jgi:hypothetical protein
MSSGGLVIRSYRAVQYNKPISVVEIVRLVNDVCSSILFEMQYRPNFMRGSIITLYEIHKLIL